MKHHAKLTVVFDAIRQGCSLYAACAKAGISSKEFYCLLAQNQAYRDEFRLALADYADQCTDDIRQLAGALRNGELDVSTAKLLIETNKWLAQKVCPVPFEEIVDDMQIEKNAEITVTFI